MPRKKPEPLYKFVCPKCGESSGTDVPSIEVMHRCIMHNRQWVKFVQEEPHNA